MKVGDLVTFLTLTIGLSLGLGATMAAAYRVDVAQNWSERRCDPAVVALAGFFKPTKDPRTASQFASDNWSFCQKEYVQAGIRAAAAVPRELTDAEGAVVGLVQGITGAVADVFFDVWRFCFEAYSSFMDRMKGAAQLAHNFLIGLHSIVGRLQAAVLSVVFGVWSLIAAFVSTVQVVLIVAIVIVGILIALQIILFFLLLPISGLIITVTAVVSVAVVIIATAIAAAMVAELFTPGVCFAAGTQIMLGRGRGVRPIEAIRIGDVLVDGGVVTAVHQFRQPELLYDLDGIRVTGDHLLVTPAALKRVRDWPDATLVDRVPKQHDLWCLTTTTRRIPVKGRSSAHLFADWEEIPEKDTEAQAAWYAAVWHTVNPGSPLQGRHSESEAGVSLDCQIPTLNWLGQRQLRRAVDIRLGDWLITQEGVATRVIGVVELAGDQVTDAVELRDGREIQLVSVGSWVRCRLHSGDKWTLWEHPTAEPVRELHPVRWRHFYTTAGEFQIGSGAWAIRDASDVGLHRLAALVDETVLNPASENFGGAL